jgi:hypothetical protein
MEKQIPTWEQGNKADEVQTRTASEFLLAIAGLGSAEETDLSERNEEILANDIDPIRGWGLPRNSPE